MSEEKPREIWVSEQALAQLTEYLQNGVKTHVWNKDMSPFIAGEKLVRFIEAPKKK